MSNSRVEYENTFAQQFHCSFARAFGLGREALVILLKAHEVSPGDKVGVCGYTCLSVAEAVKVCQATPVYLDVDEQLCINPEQIKKYSPGELKVVILQHTFGNPGKLDELLLACQSIGTVVVEDCAHALGCQWKNKPLGSFGTGSIFSFQWGKPYTTGQGGMLTCNSTSFIEKIDRQIEALASPMSCKEDFILACQRPIFTALLGSKLEYFLKSWYVFLREKGIVKGSFSNTVSFPSCENYVRNAGMSMAKAGITQLKKWHQNQEARKNNKKTIEEMLSRAHLPLWPISPHADITMPRYPILVSEKDKILEKAKKAKVDIAGWYNSPVHPFMGSELQNVDYQPGSCPDSENIIKQLVHIPTGSNLNKKKLEIMIKILKDHR
jgi:dTDP-4-amino-4,6-dideoxygalactose transaminase